MSDQHTGPKVRHIKATYYQAHKPTQDPPYKWQHDLVAVTIAIIVLLVIFFLSSLVAGPYYT